MMRELAEPYSTLVLFLLLRTQDEEAIGIQPSDFDDAISSTSVASSTTVATSNWNRRTWCRWTHQSTPNWCADAGVGRGSHVGVPRTQRQSREPRQCTAALFKPCGEGNRDHGRWLARFPAFAPARYTAGRDRSCRAGGRNGPQEGGLGTGGVRHGVSGRETCGVGSVARQLQANVQATGSMQ